MSELLQTLPATEALPDGEAMSDDVPRIGGIWNLPVRGPEIAPLDPAIVEAFAGISSATACAQLHRLGITQTLIEGPKTTMPGTRVVGRAVTLQFMPLREDIYQDAGETQEYVERATALWGVLDEIEPGDVLVVQAYGSPRSGVVGEMLAQHLQNRGGVGLVVDGRIRDSQAVREDGLPVWSLGGTPHYASQGELFAWAYHVPIAVGGALVIPGDIIIADDDGAVVVPVAKAEAVLAASKKHDDWEVFSRMKLRAGGALRRYYPLNEAGKAEYEQWISDGRPQIG